MPGTPDSPTPGGLQLHRQHAAAARLAPGRFQPGDGGARAPGMFLHKLNPYQGLDEAGRKALWERLQFSLDGEPDPWFDFEEAAVDTRQFDAIGT